MAKSLFQWETQTPKQDELVRAIAEHDIVFATGPAGTGKTAVGCYSAFDYLDSGRVTGIVVSRPAKSVNGEEMGFLPGSSEQKFSAYLAPIEEFGRDHPKYQTWFRKYSEKENQPISRELEAVPIAFIRGRTFTEKFVLVDEAQNLNPFQMLTILTRFGKGSKMVITGDMSQSDLPKGMMSGLDHAIALFAHHSKIKHVQFSVGDICRHDLVGDIIRFYDADNSWKRKS